jgi:exopolysaccharide biosynthesis polyprenyl glycosylphosphotransferase
VRWWPYERPRLSFKLIEHRAVLMVGDAAIAALAVELALWLWALTAGAEFSLAYLYDRRIWFYVLVPAWLILQIDLYDRRRRLSPRATLEGLLWVAVVAAVIYLGVFFFAPRGLLPRLFILYFIAGAFALSLAWRLVYIAIFVSPYFRRRALVVGAGWAGETIVAALRACAPKQYVVVGLIDDDPGKHGRRVHNAPVLGGHEELARVVQARQVNEIVLAITGELRGELFQALLDCQAQGIPVVRMPLLYEQLTGRIPIEHLDAGWMSAAFMERVQTRAWYRRFAKRLLDVAGAGLGLVLLGLLTPFVVAAVWLESGGPILFWQARLGKGRQSFEMLKFRTMIQQAEADGLPRWATPDDERVTAVGRFLRRSRLDEAPQLWNVLKGEMSLVGPRPERPEFIAWLETQIPFYRARLEVKPGLTGWAQVNYGYGATLEDAVVKLQYDLYYITHQSVWLDLLILARTVGVVLRFTGT